MQILMVSHFYEGHGGGIERVAGHLCRQLGRLGAQVTWAASDSDPAPVDIAAIPLGCINPTERLSGLPMPVPGLRALASFFREVRRCDAVIIHDALYVTSIVALLLAKWHGKRVILVQHIAAIPFASRMLQWVMQLANTLVTRPMLWATDELVFISDTVRHDLLGTPPWRPSALLFNGVDERIFQPAEGRAPVATTPRRILFVGRYVEKKGLVVIRALAAARPDLSFKLVGAGPLRPGNWGLANIDDLGTRGPTELAQLYRSADLLLLPSVGEGYPLVIQEAMACGLPVICGEPTNRADPGASAWLHGVAVDLADPDGSARRCAEVIDALVVAPSERAAMSRHALARYDWQSMAQAILTLARGEQPTSAGFPAAA